MLGSFTHPLSVCTPPLMFSLSAARQMSCRCGRESFFTSGCWVSQTGAEEVMTLSIIFPTMDGSSHGTLCSSVVPPCPASIASTAERTWGTLSSLKLAGTHDLKLGLASSPQDEAELFLALKRLRLMKRENCIPGEGSTDGLLSPCPAGTSGFHGCGLIDD